MDPSKWRCRNYSRAWHSGRVVRLVNNHKIWVTWYSDRLAGRFPPDQVYFERDRDSVFVRISPMKYRIIDLELDGRKINEVLEAPNADAFLLAARDRVARELGWKGMFLKTFTGLQFAQEAVRRYNERRDERHPVPRTADEFIEFGKSTGNLVVEDA